MFNSSYVFQVLYDFLPMINKYRDHIFVIKYGGAAMKNHKLKIKVIQDVIFLHSIGIKVVLVHGGGPFINEFLYKLNIEPKFDNGIRVTDFETMQVVEMVLAGQVNKNLVSLVNKLGVSGVGLSGKDANLIIASNLFNSKNNFVGKVEKINSDILTLLLQNNYLPIIASIAIDIEGQSYNINADIVASCIAQNLGAHKLLLLTDAPGILLDMNDNKTLIKQVCLNDILELKTSNVITGGMIPKVNACYDAVHNNVLSAHIIDGRIDKALLLELFTEDRIGSMIIK
uniref:Acetylglutamate kinase n=1 Tax=Callithamnion tetricum TaxID=193179 RepID=A0A4D6WMK4_9FLOR|nr:acetylglutamate kinase [Callithamnion tetricum]